VDLLVVGGPTHGHGMSRPQTREAARNDGAPTVRVDAGVRDRIPALSRKVDFVAAFDTRVDKPKFLTGAASKGIARLLHSHGYNLIVPPESFLVSGSKGPLVGGELERARVWGAAVRARKEASSAAA
jgi:hypothetical protein